MKSSWVVIPTTLGGEFFMQMRGAIIEKPILFNIVKRMRGTLSKIVSLAIFSRSVNRINIVRKC